jgi:hypothetical protein
LLFGSMFEASDICCRSWGKVTVLAYSLIQRCHTWNGIEPRTVLMYKRTFSENLLFSKNFVVKDGCCKLTRYVQTSFGLTRMRRLVSFPPPASCLLFRLCISHENLSGLVVNAQIKLRSLDLG